jgi:hypothetical protein
MQTPFPAKYRGQCAHCQGLIRRGSPIVSFGFKQSVHAACAMAYDVSNISRQAAAFNASDHSSAEDRCCGDRAYEDACARACGF